MHSFVPDRMPALDPVAGALLGAELERLEGLGARQPYRSQGPWLEPAAVTLLDTAAEAGKVGRFQLASLEAGVAVLDRAGLMDAKGRLTAAGLTVTAPLADPQGGLFINTGYLGRGSSLQMVLGTQDALLLAGASHADLTGPEPERHAGLLQLDLVSLNDVFPALAAWLGIAPGWTAPAAPLEVSVEHLNRRLTDPDEPAPVQDAMWLRMWNEPWFLWHVSDGPEPDGDAGWGYIRAGRAGQHRVVVDGETATLLPVGSSRAYRDLTSAVEGALLNGAGSPAAES